MGQYFVAVNLNKKEYLNPEKFNCKMELMECWANNISKPSLGLFTLLQNRWKNNNVILLGEYDVSELYNDIEIYKDISEDISILNSIDNILENSDLFHNMMNNKILYDKTYFLKFKDYYENDINLINPIPLLLATSNGMGYSDYDGLNKENSGLMVKRNEEEGFESNTVGICDVEDIDVYVGKIEFDIKFDIYSKTNYNFQIQKNNSISIT